MERLLFLRVVTVTRQVRQIVSRLSEDADALNKQFFPGTSFKRIDGIKCGISDTHNGQKVAKIFLNNDKILIYKPRNLEKDQSFMELYGQICGNSGLSFQNIRILARKDYSWESYAEQRPCKSETEVKRYFQRIGILLFLCRLMGVSDMHGENIIADGEYPMPIDLETLPGNSDHAMYEDADRAITEELKHSVLSTGILPVITWGGGGDIGFYGPQVEENGNFRIGPSGIYLYEGIGGITVFPAVAVQEYQEEKYKNIPTSKN